MKPQDALADLASGLRVAQVIGTFGGGGAQRLAYNLAAGLAARGAFSMALALRGKGNYGDGEGAILLALSADPQRPATLVRALLALRGIVRKKRIAVLHVHGAPSLPFVVLATRWLHQPPRLAFTWHDSESVLEQRGWRRWLMRWALHRCDAVSGSSGIVAKRLAERAGLSGVGVLHGGVPVSPEPSPAQDQAPLIVWLGRIVPPKDPQILVRAAARLRDEGMRFRAVIAGKPIASTGWYMDETQALIDKLGLRDLVSLPGYVGGKALQDLMHRAHISVQTSHTEGLSLALLEQMMTGLGIVATDVGDTRKAVEDGISGLLIPPKDEGLLVHALRRLLTDTSLRSKLGRAARERAVREFSVDSMVSRAAAQYAELLARR